MRCTIILAILAVIVVQAAGMAGSIGTALAAPRALAPSPSTPVYTHQTTRIISFAGTQRCADLQRAAQLAGVSQVNNQALCTATLTEWSTDLTPLPSAYSHTARVGGPSPLDSCISAQKTLTVEEKDPVSDDILATTTFRWYGNCQAPSITYKHCWFNYIYGNNISQQCLSEYPNSIYSDNWYGVTFNPWSAPFLTVTDWLESAGYYDGSTSQCSDLGGTC